MVAAKALTANSASGRNSSVVPDIVMVLMVLMVLKNSNVHKTKTGDFQVTCLCVLGGRWDWLRCILHRLTPTPAARRRGASKLLNKSYTIVLLIFSIPTSTSRLGGGHRKNKKMSYDILLFESLGGRWDSNCEAVEPIP